MTERLQHESSKPQTANIILKTICKVDVVFGKLKAAGVCMKVN
jgi:hypothetical protein